MDKSIGFSVSGFMDAAWRSRSNFQNQKQIQSQERRTGVSAPTLHCSARQAQGSFDRFDNLRIHFYPRIQRAKFIVKNLAHHCCVTKDASGHGHRDRSAMVLREEAVNYDRGRLREFPASVGENLCGQLVGTGGDSWKQSCEVGRW